VITVLNAKAKEDEVKMKKKRNLGWMIICVPMHIEYKKRRFYYCDSQEPALKRRQRRALTESD
jgi:hypothetical protein